MENKILNKLQKDTSKIPDIHFHGLYLTYQQVVVLGPPQQMEVGPPQQMEVGAPEAHLRAHPDL